VMSRIAAARPGYDGLSYTRLSQVTEQWPIIGRADLYYGGTTYENSQGLGVQLASALEKGETVSLSWPELPVVEVPESGLLGVPVTRLYDLGQTVSPSILLHPRLPAAYVAVNPEDAGRLGLVAGNAVQISLNGTETLTAVQYDTAVPAGIVLVPRSLGMPIVEPVPVVLRLAEQVSA